MAHFHGNVSSKHVHGDGSWAAAPAIVSLVPTATGATVTYSGPATHYRVDGGTAVAIPSNPFTFSGLAANTEPHTVELSADGGSTWPVMSAAFGTLNPGTGSGGVEIAGVSGSGSAVLALGASLGAAVARVAGTGAAVLGRAVQAAAGSVRIAGTGAAVLPAALAAAAGAVSITGSGSAAFSRFVAAGSGIVGAAPVIGSGSATLGLAAAGAGSVRVAGAGSAVLGLVSSGSGTVSGAAGITGTGWAVLRAFGLADGTVTGEGSAATYEPQPRTSSSWSYKQTATLWRRTSRDDWTGLQGFAAPVWFLCDYTIEARKMRDAKGEEFVTRMVVYTSLPNINRGDRIKIGALTAADPLAAGAEEVRSVLGYADTFKADAPLDFKLAT